MGMTFLVFPFWSPFSSRLTPQFSGGASRRPLQPFVRCLSLRFQSTEDLVRGDRLPVRSIEPEKLEFLGTPPLCQDDSLCPVILGDPRQARNICRRGSGRRASLGLNEDDVEEVSALERWAIVAVILPDSDQVNDTASFSLRLAPEVHQVPLGSRAPTIRNEPLRHRPCPLCSVVGLLARAHHFSGACHDSLAANNNYTVCISHQTQTARFCI